MKRIIFFAFIIFCCIIACGCTQQSETSAGNSLAQLSSSNPDATLSLDQGAIIVSFSAEEAQKMEISIAGLSGEYGEFESFSITGPYKGSVVFGVPEKNEYLLNISSSGYWKAEVTKPVTTPAMSVPVNLSGSGTEATPFFLLEKGEYIFSRNETGFSSPVYMLRYSNGSVVMDGNNTYAEPGFGEASPEPFRIITIADTGSYILSVIAESSPSEWSVSIMPVPLIPAMGPGPVIIGTGME